MFTHSMLKSDGVQKKQRNPETLYYQWSKSSLTKPDYSFAPQDPLTQSARDCMSGTFGSNKSKDWKISLYFFRVISEGQATTFTLK